MHRQILPYLPMHELCSHALLLPSPLPVQGPEQPLLTDHCMHTSMYARFSTSKFTRVSSGGPTARRRGMEARRQGWGTRAGWAPQGSEGSGPPLHAGAGTVCCLHSAAPTSHAASPVFQGPPSPCPPQRLPTCSKAQGHHDVRAGRPLTCGNSGRRPWPWG